MEPELRYLRALARAYIAGKQTCERSPGHLNWLILKELLLRHRVLTSLAPLILKGDTPWAPPGEVQQLLRQYRRRTAFLHLELCRILPTLEHGDCVPIVLKGSSIAYTSYDNQLDRTFADLDVLVKPDRVQTACQLMAGHGYSPAQTLQHASYFDDCHFHRILQGRSGAYLEIHWGLSTRDRFWRFDIKEVYEGARVITCDKSRMRVLSQIDQLFCIVAQGLTEGFSQLRRVFDTVLILRKLEDKSSLKEESRKRGMTTALWVLLSQAREYLQEGIPTTLLDELRPQKSISSFLELLIRRGTFLRPYSRRSAFRETVMCLCADNLKAGLLQLKHYLVPTRQDYLDMGYQPEQMPGTVVRIWTSIWRFKALLKALTYHAKCIFG